jgi:hypothetical protein
MTRLPGEPLSQVWGDLLDEKKTIIVNEIDQRLLRLHQIRSPASPRISSISATHINSFQAPDGIISPCSDKMELLEYLSSPCGPRSRAYDPSLLDANTEEVNRILDYEPSIVFAHGD